MMTPEQRIAALQHEMDIQKGWWRLFPSTITWDSIKNYIQLRKEWKQAWNDFCNEVENDLEGR